MLVCHQHRFIFVKTRKTAGTSIEISLTRYCGPSDIVTPITEADEPLRSDAGIEGPRNFDEPIPLGSWRLGQVRQLMSKHRWPRRRLFWNHMTAAQIAARLPTEWSEYTTLSVVRNPWDYVVSRYWWEVHRQQRPDLTVDDVLERWDPAQNWSSLQIDGQLAVDRVCRFENLTGDLRQALGTVGVDFDGWLPRAKASTGRPPGARATLEDRHIGRIAERCAAEISAFGYEPPSD